MPERKKFTGQGYNPGEFSDLERAQLREVLNHLRETYVDFDPAVLEKLESAATIVAAVGIVSRIIAYTTPIGVFIGWWFSQHGVF